MIRFAMLTAVLLSALAGSPMLAQEHQHDTPAAAQGDTAGMAVQTRMMQMMQGLMRGDMMGGAMAGGGMMGPMHPQPAALLRAANALALSAEQRQRLGALIERTGQEAQRHMQAAMAARERARSLLSDESPDLEAYAALLQEAADHQVQGHVAAVRASVEGVALLTPEQREKLRTGMEIMRSMSGGGAMSGEMMGGGGMGPQR